MDYWVRIFKIIFFLGLAGMIFLLWQKNPYQSQAAETLNWLMVVAFNLAFFFFLWSFFFILFFKLKTRSMTRKGKNSQVALVARQSFWLALAGLILLILQQFRALFWWDGLLVVAAIMLLETYFLSFEKKEEERGVF